MDQEVKAKNEVKPINVGFKTRTSSPGVTLYVTKENLNRDKIKT